MIAETARQANRRRALADADRAVTVAEVVASAEVKAATDYVLRRLEKHPDGLARRDLTIGASKKVRPELGAALAMLTDAGRILLDTSERSGNPAEHYRLAARVLVETNTDQHPTANTHNRRSDTVSRALVVGVGRNQHPTAGMPEGVVKSTHEPHPPATPHNPRSEAISEAVAEGVDPSHTHTEAAA